MSEFDRHALSQRCSPTLSIHVKYLHIGSQIFDIEQFAEAVAKISTVGTFRRESRPGPTARRLYSLQPGESLEQRAALTVVGGEIAHDVETDNGRATIADHEAKTLNSQASCSGHSHS